MREDYYFLRYRSLLRCYDWLEAVESRGTSGTYRPGRMYYMVHWFRRLEYWLFWLSWRIVDTVMLILENVSDVTGIEISRYLERVFTYPCCIIS